MQTMRIIQEIYKLPMDEKFFVVEQIIKAIKSEEQTHQLSFAANELFDDYTNDKELTAFTSLDLEHFYEAG